MYRNPEPAIAFNDFQTGAVHAVYRVQVYAENNNIILNYIVVRVPETGPETLSTDDRA